MKKCKIMKVLILILFILFILSSRVFALGDWMKEASDGLTDGKASAESGYTIDTDELEKGSDILFNMFLAAGTVVAVIVGAILGIQFMTAGIDKKVEVKQSLFPYIISCIVMFGAFGIWKLMVIILNGI